MLPMMPLDGAKVFAWSKLLWLSFDWSVCSFSSLVLLLLWALFM